MNVVTINVPSAHFPAIALPENMQPLRGAPSVVILAIPVLIAADIKKNQAVVIVAPHVLAAVKNVGIAHRWIILVQKGQPVIVAQQVIRLKMLAQLNAVMHVMYVKKIKK